MVPSRCFPALTYPSRKVEVKMLQALYILSLFSWRCLKVLSDILITGLYSWNFYDSEIFSGRIPCRQPETRRICYLVHYLVVGRLAGLYLASSRTPSPSALSSYAFLFYSHFFSYSPEFAFLTSDFDYSYLIWIKEYRAFLQNIVYFLWLTLWYWRYFRLHSLKY